MKYMDDFFTEIYTNLSNEEGLKIDDKSINFFDIFFNGHEEVTLHSRFISFLLSKNKDFLKLFIEQVLNLNNTDFKIDDSEVFPNENIKSEFKEIDILIINKLEKQAIIIENKIHAKPSFIENKEKGYKGQLERYFNTIINGIDNFQEFKSEKNTTYPFFLTLYRKPDPIKDIGISLEGIFDYERNIINYYSIQKWLQLCITNSEDKSINLLINQYYNFLTNMTTNNNKVLEITNLIENNPNFWQSAFEFNNYFKDVKWHIIHRFYTELTSKLKCEMCSEDDITQVAHNLKRKALTINFSYEDLNMYITNDEKGFTIGSVNPKKWFHFENDELKKINFYNFNNEETYKLLNKEYRDAIINEIYNSIVIYFNKISDIITGNTHDFENDDRYIKVKEGHFILRPDLLEIELKRQREEWDNGGKEIYDEREKNRPN